MFAPMMAAASGGGSVKSGTTEAVAASGTLTIDTGLSQINQFVWFAECAGQAGKLVVMYDRNADSGKYTSSRIQTSQGTYNGAIGASPTAYLPSLYSLSGGTITIKTPTAANMGAASAGVWFAQ